MTKPARSAEEVLNRLEKFLDKESDEMYMHLKVIEQTGGENTEIWRSTHQRLYALDNVYDFVDRERGHKIKDDCRIIDITDSEGNVVHSVTHPDYLEYNHRHFVKIFDEEGYPIRCFNYPECKNVHFEYTENRARYHCPDCDTVFEVIDMLDNLLYLCIEEGKITPKSPHAFTWQHRKRPDKRLN